MTTDAGTGSAGPAHRSVPPAVDEVAVDEVAVDEVADGATPPPNDVEGTAPVARLAALDALRGIAIGLMVMVNWPGSEPIPVQLIHSEWHGLRVADVVFPMFLTSVGVSMTLTSRTSSFKAVAARTAKLVLLGSLLVCFKEQLPVQLTWGVLQHIAAAYFLTWLVLRLPRRVQTPVVALVLAAVSLAYLRTSFDPGTNAGQLVDDWLGIAPSAENPHSFLPSVGNVYIGVLAGRILARQGATVAETRRRLAVLGAGALALGLALAPWIPLNKYLWTPTFAVATAGVSVLVLLVLLVVLPPGSTGGLLRPLVLLGRHPIAVYAFSETVVGRARDDWLWPHLGPVVDEAWGKEASAVVFPLLGVAACLVLAWVMERAGIRLRL